MAKGPRTKGNVRAIPDEVASEIQWNKVRGRVGAIQHRDEEVRKACGLLVEGRTILVEEPAEGPSHLSAQERVNAIRSRLGSRVRSTCLTDIQAEGLRVSPDSEFIPRFAVVLRPLEEIVG